VKTTNPKVEAEFQQLIHRTANTPKEAEEICNTADQMLKDHPHLEKLLDEKGSSPRLSHEAELLQEVSQ